jgi:demethylmenaquinone methyltransferase / 2-methoxy-6-polyprenyl-1,4-benzoquinol methylase
MWRRPEPHEPDERRVTTPGVPHPVLPDYYRRAEERQAFVTALFDSTATQYDRLCRLMSLGSGQRYRGWVLRRIGLRPGMKLLDVATGTGLVARAATSVVRNSHAVIGIDPSRGMLRVARTTLSSPLAQGCVEQLPFRADVFDVLTMGYALRHAADLEIAFRECLRVMKPGGRLLILEISRPAAMWLRTVIRVYFTRLLPWLMRVGTGHGDSGVLIRYYWETIENCVPPETILEALRRSGFVDLSLNTFGGLLAEYVAVKPRR